MTTRRSFDCNLCRSVIADEAAGRGFSFRTGFSLEWAASLSQTENHLCGACIRSLITALKAPGIQEDYGK